MNKFASKDSRWDNYCNKLILLIDGNDEDFPDEEAINKLVKYTEQAFGGTPFMQHAMDKAFSLRRRWEKKRKQLNRRNRQELPLMEEKFELSDEIKESATRIITKLAQENNIALADKVVIRLSKDEGIVMFKGAEDLIPGGKADDMPVSEFPKDQINKGIEIEFEHTDDPAIAQEIAKDHLVEDDEYYDYLADMEDLMKESLDTERANALLKKYGMI